MIYLITYDLRFPGRDYSDLFAAIKSLGAWWHYLGSVWLVAPTNQTTVANISELLRGHIDKNDSLYVTTIGPNNDGWLPKDAWDWIRNHRQTQNG